MTRRARIRLQAAREDGVALVMAVIVIMIVFISAGTAIYVTSASQQDAYSKKATQTAYGLAQGALSNAMAQLTALYYDNDGQPTDQTSSLSDMAGWASSVAPANSGGQQSSTDQTACTSSSTCMDWSAVLNCPDPSTDCPGGTAISVSGVERAIWLVTGTGTAPNPSGTTARTRTITIEIPVDQKPATVGAPDIFNAIYSGKTGSTCDMNMDQQVQFAAPVYVLGNLCLKSGGAVVDPTKLIVGGYIDNQGHGDIGTSSSPLPELDVGQSCDGTEDTTPGSCLASLQPPGWYPPTPPNSYQSYYSLASQSTYATSASDSTSFPDPPSVDWAQRQTDRGSWDCGGARDLTSDFVLTSSVHYDCTSESGSLSWDGTTLTIAGNIFIDGNLTSQNADIKVQGLGGIFVAGTIDLGTNTRICSVDSGFSGSHDCGPIADWDTEKNFVMFDACASSAKSISSCGTSTPGIQANNLTLQGGLYSDSDISFGSGQTRMYGPIVTPQEVIPGQIASSDFPSVLELISGQPGTAQPYWTLGTPQNGTY